jgi:hypothetical protein
MQEFFAAAAKQMKSPYSTLPILNLDRGILYIPLTNFLELLQARANVLAEEAARPGVEPIPTELLRGQRAECLLLIQALKELTPKPSGIPLLDLNLT